MGGCSTVLLNEVSQMRSLQSLVFLCCTCWRLDSLCAEQCVGMYPSPLPLSLSRVVAEATISLFSSLTSSSTMPCSGDVGTPHLSLILHFLFVIYTFLLLC